MPHALARLVLVVLVVLALPAAALAGTGAGTPFPTNLLTTSDSTQATGLRIDLPPPDCAARPSDCADVAVLNTLDGFNVQPRISIPFDGPIDVSTVSSDTVYLVDARGARTGIVEAERQRDHHQLHAAVRERPVRSCRPQAVPEHDRRAQRGVRHARRGRGRE